MMGRMCLLAQDRVRRGTGIDAQEGDPTGIDEGWVWQTQVSKDAAIGHADIVACRAPNAGSRMTRSAPYAALGGKSIIERIADHFRSHPTVSFSPAEVMPCRRPDRQHRGGPRQRLVTRGTLKHVGHAKYQYNEPENHPTQS